MIYGTNPPFGSCVVKVGPGYMQFGIWESGPEPMTPLLSLGVLARIWECTDEEWNSLLFSECSSPNKSPSDFFTPGDVPGLVADHGPVNARNGKMGRIKTTLKDHYIEINNSTR